MVASAVMVVVYSLSSTCYGIWLLEAPQLRKRVLVL